jgi:hypothetical protein
MALLLTGCGPSVDTRPVVELQNAAAGAPTGLLADCADPADIPAGPISAGAVERVMAGDRTSLVDCKARHGALRDFYRARDAGLAGK